MSRGTSTSRAVDYDGVEGPGLRGQAPPGPAVLAGVLPGPVVPTLLLHFFLGGGGVKAAEQCLIHAYALARKCMCRYNLVINANVFTVTQD